MWGVHIFQRWTENVLIIYLYFVICCRYNIVDQWCAQILAEEAVNFWILKFLVGWAAKWQQFERANWTSDQCHFSLSNKNEKKKVINKWHKPDSLNTSYQINRFNSYVETITFVIFASSKCILLFIATNYNQLPFISWVGKFLIHF